MTTLASSIFDIRVDDVAFGVLSLESPWAFRVRRGRFSLLYAPRAASAWLAVGDEAAFEVRAGSIVALPQGHAHAWRDRPGRLPRTIWATPPLTSPRDGDGDPSFIVARIPTATNPLPDVLPAAIVVPPEERALHQRLRPLLALAVNEYGDATRPTRLPVLQRVAEIIAIELTEYCIGRAPGGWPVRALDACVRRALGALHSWLAHPWSLAELAGEVSLSRSALAVRFRASVGDTPLSYLTRIRMQHAALLLSDSGLPLAMIAARVGYRSEDAFAKAFRRVMNTTPRRWRERAGG